MFLYETKWRSLLNWLHKRTLRRNKLKKSIKSIWSYNFDINNEIYFTNSTSNSNFKIKTPRKSSFDRDTFIEETSEDKNFDQQICNELLEKKSEPEKEKTTEKKETILKEEICEKEDLFGPSILEVPVLPTNQNLNYGGALLAGEGEAMAQFVQAGKRIPRRGEVGLTGEQIEMFERIGYVMSGSMHKRMTAVRIRKESQVYTVEERRNRAIQNEKERLIKEAQLIGDLRELIKKEQDKF